jgi:hypothetical protein
MADLKLDILVIETYNKLTLGIADISTYPDSPSISTPSITIEIPNGFGSVTLPFVPKDFNVFNSSSLGLSAPGDELTPLPDGVYIFTYSVIPSFENFVTKTFQRTEVIQEKFDDAFMKLDMMQCDMAIKTQSKVDLSTIYFFIQGSKAAANECAIDTANTLYKQANKQLCNFIANNCGCSRGNNFITNFV